MQLSSLPLKSPLSSHSNDSFIFPTPTLQVPGAAAGEGPASLSVSLASALTTDTATDALSSSTATLSSTNTAAPPSRDRPGSFQPSGLSLLLARQSPENAAVPAVISEDSLVTPTAERPSAMAPETAPPQMSQVSEGSQAISQESRRRYSERSHLLADPEAVRTPYTSNGHAPNGNGHTQPDAVGKRTSRGRLSGWGKSVWMKSRSHDLRHVPATIVKSLPAVLLGTLLNILDGISCAFFPPLVVL